MRRLFVPGYYSGFSNNKMSLDIAVVAGPPDRPDLGALSLSYCPDGPRWTCPPTAQ